MPDDLIALARRRAKQLRAGSSKPHDDADIIDALADALEAERARVRELEAARGGRGSPAARAALRGLSTWPRR